MINYPAMTILYKHCRERLIFSDLLTLLCLLLSWTPSSIIQASIVDHCQALYLASILSTIKIPKVGHLRITKRPGNIARAATMVTDYYCEWHVFVRTRWWLEWMIWWVYKVKQNLMWCKTNHTKKGAIDAELNKHEHMSSVLKIVKLSTFEEVLCCVVVEAAVTGDD